MNKRTHIKRVIIDTPALLNMVKHCRESDSAVARGHLMGVMQKSVTGEPESLLVTQTLPETNKAQMTDLYRTMENEKQKLMDTNEIGFYINARMGLCFTRETLNNLLSSSKKFKNSFFVVYDTQKANYGMNPLHAFRLTEKAI